MTKGTHIHLFDDQNEERVGLSTLFDLAEKDRPLLRVFLQRAYLEIRLRLEKAGYDENLGQSSNFQDLAAMQHKGHIHALLNPALFCAFQLGCFIGESGKSHHIYSKRLNRYFVGIRIGSLSSAAASCATNTEDLIPIAIAIIGIAVDLGIKIYERAESIEHFHGSDGQQWSLVVKDISAIAGEEALNRFLVENPLPVVSRPCLSQIWESSVTFNGPPTSLKALERSQFSTLKTWSLANYGPCHNGSIFGQKDIQEILDGTLPDLLSDSPSFFPVLSGATGRLVTGGNLAELVRNSLEEILLQQINRQNITQGIAYCSGFAKHSSVINIHSQTKEGAMSLVECLNKMGYVSKLSEVQIPAKTSSERNGFKAKLAIVGMSGRFPEAESPDAFWNVLSQGLDVHKTVPKTRWDVNTHVDVTLSKKNTSGTSFGCWLNNPGHFDRKFFNISPRETPQVDPASRLALMTAYEAMEQAGMVPGRTPSTRRDRVGVFYGVTSNDWMENNTSQNIDTYFIAGGCRAFIPGRINYFFKLSGPSLSIDTACSSSLSAIHVACNSIWQGDCDTAIAGGTNILTNPDYTAGLDRGHFLSRSGNCKSFDDDADGYCRGEGIVSVIIKRLEDAVFDKDPILGVIAGASTNHSAEAVSITRPHIGAQQAIFDKILNDANVEANEVSYVEMHGTGTQVGDTAEMQSVLETFASPTNPRKSNQQLFLGSVKANVGHGEGVAGATSLAKVLLMLKHNTIPPHCGIKTKINHKFPTNLAGREVYIAAAQVPWAKPKNGVRRAFINNFSAAGGNSALLIEEAPPKHKEEGNDPRNSHVVTVSAKTSISLTQNLKSLLHFLQSNSNIGLPELSYTTTARRAHFSHRAVTIGSDLEQIISGIRKELEQPEQPTPSRILPKITFAFAGNGSQYPGMGRELFLTLPRFRAEILRLDQLVRAQGFPSIIEAISETKTTSASKNKSSVILQLSLVCMEIALANVWIYWGVKPGLVLGHSLGEYAALNISGVLSDSDTIYIVGRRAQLMDERCKHGTNAMLFISASVATISQHLTDYQYEISCINGPKATVISGTLEMVSEIRAVFDAMKITGIKCSLLDCHYAYHSAQVNPILVDLESAAHSLTFQTPKFSVLSPLRSGIIKDGDVFGPKYLSDHCRKPVNMLSALKVANQTNAIGEQGIVLDIGPQATFFGMIEPVLGTKVQVLPTLRRNRDPWTMSNEVVSSLYLAGVDIDWKAFQSGFEACHKVLDLPRYSWDLEDYWIQYVNDWSLRKGDPVPTQQDTRPQAIFSEPVPFPKSTTIHRALQDVSCNGAIRVSSETDISHPDLIGLAQGHKVNNIPLATPSIYADIVFALITYIIKRYEPHLISFWIEISNLTIEHALVAHGRPEPQLLISDLAMDTNSKMATARFSNGKLNHQAVQYAHCKIHIRQNSLMKESLSSKSAGAKRRLLELRESLKTGATFRFNTSMIYRMVATIAQFDSNYQALEEIILDSSAMEASSVVCFSKVELQENQTFHTHPAFIDALTQSAGFVMNANDSSDLEVEVFVNHGWDKFQLYERLENGGKYQTLVKMRECPRRTWKGDLLVLRGDQIVACFEGIILQGVPKKVLYYMLTKEKENMERLLPQRNERQNKARSISTEYEKSTEFVSEQIAINKSHLQPPRAEQDSDQVREALKIISEESGLAVHELGDSCHFMDVGIDSLLVLQILSRFRSDLNLDMDSSAFNELSTIQSLKEYLEPGNQGEFTRDSISRPRETSNPDSLDLPVLTQDDFISERAQAGPHVFDYSLEETSDQNAIPTKVITSLRIISEESGVPMDELMDDVVFTDIGIDSTLSLMISARLREELSLESPEIDRIFSDSLTVRNLKIALGDTCTPEQMGTGTGTVLSTPSIGSVNDAPISVFSDQNNVNPSSSSSSGDRKSKSAPKATSVLLRGRPQSAAKTLILFPDGSGSAASYINIPNVHSSLCIIALNCPYLYDPESMTCTLDELLDLYLAEVRRRKPHGPYNFGGWSCGGILAYRAAQRMILEGEDVETLSLIDAPVPKGLDPLPTRWYDHCAKHGIFNELFKGNVSRGSSPLIPGWLVPHFQANVDILRNYYAEPLPAGFTPRTSILWASECVTDGFRYPAFEKAPSDAEGIKFLTEKRVDFSAGEWEDLLPGSKVEVETLVGANHFSMMGPAYSAQMGGFLDRATR